MLPATATLEGKWNITLSAQAQCYKARILTMRRASIQKDEDIFNKALNYQWMAVGTWKVTKLPSTRPWSLRWTRYRHRRWCRWRHRSDFEAGSVAGVAQPGQRDQGQTSPLRWCRALLTSKSKIDFSNSHFSSAETTRWHNDSRLLKQSDKTDKIYLKLKLQTGRTSTFATSLTTKNRPKNVGVLLQFFHLVVGYLAKLWWRTIGVYVEARSHRHQTMAPQYRGS